MADGKNINGQHVVVLALIVILVVFVVRAVRMMSPAPLPPAIASGTSTSLPNTPPPTPLPAPVIQPSLAPPKEPLYTAQELRDPMKSWFPEDVTTSVAVGGATTPLAPNQPFPSVNIQGMVWGGPQPAVIISDQVYGVGDSVQGMTIKSITRDGITVEFAGQLRHLTPSQKGFDSGRL